MSILRSLLKSRHLNHKTFPPCHGVTILPITVSTSKSPLRTLLQLSTCHLPSFQAVPHSLRKNTRGWGTTAPASAREPDTLVTITPPANPSLSIACAHFPSPRGLYASAFNLLATPLPAAAGHSPLSPYPLSFQRFRRPPLLTPLAAQISKNHPGGGAAMFHLPGLQSVYRPCGAMGARFRSHDMKSRKHRLHAVRADGSIEGEPNY